MFPLLLITATSVEGRPVREGLSELERLDFPLGELYRGHFAHLPVFLAHLGVGKVNTAAGLALALEATGAETVLQFGVGGAFPGSGLEPGELALAAHELHLDSGLRDGGGWHDMRALGFPLLDGRPPYYNLFPIHPELLIALKKITGALSGGFGTSENVTGTFEEEERLAGQHGVIVESMEGAAAAQVCTALRVPFGELRGISNLVGERDKRNWRLAAAVLAANQAVLDLLREC
ncbi:futalosine hydrolase [soil metagenome]